MVTGALFEPKALCGSTSGSPAVACGGVGRGAALPDSAVPDSAVFSGAAGEEETAGATFRSFGGGAGCAEGSGWGARSTLNRSASAGERPRPIWRPRAIKARTATVARIARRLTTSSKTDSDREARVLPTQTPPDYHRFVADARGLQPELAMTATHIRGRAQEFDSVDPWSRGAVVPPTPHVFCK